MGIHLTLAPTPAICTAIMLAVAVASASFAVATAAPLPLSGMHLAAFVDPLPNRKIGGMKTLRSHSRYNCERPSNRLSLKLSLCATPGPDSEDATANSLPLKENASRKRVRYIAKTIESFKLADLYWLESCVMSYCQQRGKQKQQSHPNPADESTSSTQTIESNLVRRIAFHRPTASYLIGYDQINENVPDTSRDEQIMTNAQRMNIDLPFRPSRFQYVAKVIASGQTPQQLLNSIVQDDGFIIASAAAKKSWVLDYDTFEPLRNPMHPKKTFSSTMLMCAVSRVLPGEPSLASASADIFGQNGDDVASYMIVETATSLYLAQKISCDDDDIPNRNIDSLSSLQLRSTNAIADQFRTSWSRRPFQYSGAINLDVALTAVDILRDVLQLNNSGTKAIRILDPTCGSGTFLALALMTWGNEKNGPMVVEATGIDSNLKCAHGTMQNLRHLFSGRSDEDESNNNCNDEDDDDDDDKSSWTLTLDTNATCKATIYSEDSVRLPSFISQKYDCAVANLPWNRNTFEFQGNNNNDNNDGGDCASSGILKATAAALKPGSPLVVVSGGHHNEQQGEGGNAKPDLTFNVRNCLENLGFEVLGVATIPPKGFELPASGKMGDGSRTATKKRKTSRSSDCVITVAVTPQDLHAKNDNMT